MFLRESMSWKLKVSIQLISPASGNGIDPRRRWDCPECFHSINIPSEWEFNRWSNLEVENYHVSIQLISPASGNLLLKEETL